MNSLQSTIVTSPFGKDEECGMFVIDTVQSPFIFDGLTNAGQEYTLSFWVRSAKAASVTIGEDKFSTKTSWTKVATTFIADDAYVSIFFNTATTYYIYHIQMELGNQPTDWTPAPEDVDDNINKVQKNLDDLEVGGRNLLLNSNITYTVTGTGTAASYTSSNPPIKYDVNFDELSKIPVGNYITMSVYVKIENAVFGGSGSKRCGFEASLVREDGSMKYSGVWIQACDNFEGRISNILPILEKDIFTGVNAQPYLYVQGLVSGTVTISQPKLEVGTKATAWTPAPEDVDKAIVDKGEELGQVIVEQSQSAKDAANAYTDEKLNDYVESDDFISFEKDVSARLDVMDENVTISIETLTKQIVAVNNELTTNHNLILKYFEFGENGLVIGVTDNPYKTRIDNDRYSMTMNNVEILYFDGNGKGYIPDLTIDRAFNLLGLRFEKDSNGNLNCEYNGG